MCEKITHWYVTIVKMLFVFYYNHVFSSLLSHQVALLTVTYLDILCSATANHHGYQALRNDIDLLKCSISKFLQLHLLIARNVFDK